jgi:sphinganine C4-monooxygenase
VSCRSITYRGHVTSFFFILFVSDRHLLRAPDACTHLFLTFCVRTSFVQLEGHGHGRGAAADGLAAAPAEAEAEPFLVAAARFGVAMLVLDAWQYFMHRLMHSVPYMYRRFHSWHHRVAAPYAYAAQYGHPVDAVLTETLSGAAAYLASGMSPRVAAAFFVFATVKGVDDHCGVAAPWNPLHAAFRNNTAYHDVHHQRGGGRRNFSQPFFVVWDRLLGTHAPYALRQRDGGGLEVKAFKGRQMQ